MAKRNDGSRNIDRSLREEAESYLDALPDETAEGRLVTDSGTAASNAAWESEEARQQARLRKKGNQAQ